MNQAPRSNQSGFTLIELLVVIAIIGIISSIVMVSLDRARNNARDAAIKQQVKDYATTLELEWTQVGDLQNHQTGWVGNSGTFNPDCAGETYTGAFGSKFREFCQGILNLTTVTSPNMFYVGSAAGGNTFSVMILLNNENWFCRGSSGQTYEGPVNSWTGSGCYANP